MKKAIKRVVLIALALFILALGTPAWAFSGGSHFHFGHRFGHHGGAILHFGFGHGFSHHLFHPHKFFHSHPKVFHYPHFFPHHHHGLFFGFTKAWVPSRWVKTLDGWWIWVPGHWTVINP